MAAAATTDAIARAGAAVRTADTFLSALFGLIDIERCAAKNQQKDCDNDNVFHSLLLSAESVLSFDLLAGIDTQEHSNQCHHCHCDTATEGGDERQWVAHNQTADGVD